MESPTHLYSAHTRCHGNVPLLIMSLGTIKTGGPLIRTVVVVRSITGHDLQALKPLAPLVSVTT